METTKTAIQRKRMIGSFARKESIVRQSRLSKRLKMLCKKQRQILRSVRTKLLVWEKRSVRKPRKSKLAARKADQSRLAAQLEVLEQAEKSLQGYAEGARFLLDAARQSKFKGASGALSASLEVPAELETAIAAALGEHLDAVLLESAQLDNALNLINLTRLVAQFCCR